MRPGLLTELLGEETIEAQPEPFAPRMLRAGGEERRAEVRTEKAPQGHKLDSGAAIGIGPGPVKDKTASLVCPTCDFAARSAAGLASHRRRHA